MVACQRKSNFLSLDAYLKVELLDEQLRVVPGFSGAESGLLKQNGLRQLVQWGNSERLEKFSEAIRLRVSYEGVRPEDVRVYAVYVA